MVVRTQSDSVLGCGITAQGDTGRQTGPCIWGKGAACLAEAEGGGGGGVEGGAGAVSAPWLIAWLFWTFTCVDCSVLNLMMPFLVTH